MLAEVLELRKDIVRLGRAWKGLEGLGIHLEYT